MLRYVRILASMFAKTRSMFTSSTNTATGRSNRATQPSAGNDLISSFEESMALFKNIVDQDAPEAPNPSDTETLRVNGVTLDIKKNTTAHHTNEFDITDAKQGDTTDEFLVVRRGQPFDIAIDFNRPYQADKDDLRFVFQFGVIPIPSRRTHVEFILSDKDTVKNWGGWIKSMNGNSAVITLMTSADCHVGKWKFLIDVVKKKDGGLDVFRYKHKDPIYVLFNPWCKEDPVYLHDDNLLKEYVLSDKGIIYYGSYRSIAPRDWVFGQFDGNILDCTLYLLDQTMMEKNRGNPVRIARKLSQMVNSQDDNGVLVGNWSGDNSGGTPPLDWTGSTEILEQYWKTKKPVKYGQCWVFSGVLTTACRAIGIPVRSVTNFASAHDTDGSVTIDIHVNEKYEPVEHLNGDSVWNYHVWNEVWMTRPDMPKGYGGWQAIDATPQETSEGVFCCGPTSLAALRQGEVFYPYDGPFVFAEVNADRVYWMVAEDGTLEVIKKQVYSVGRNISTKKPLKDEREDVTSCYKYPEFSDEERAAVKMAELYSSAPDFKNPDGDVEFSIDYNPDTFMGDDLEVSLKMKNKSDSPRTVDGSLILTSMYYTGVHYKDIKTEKINNLQLKPKTEEKVTIKVTQNDYLPNLTDHCNCKTTVICHIEETKQTHADMTELRFRKPHLTLKAPTTVKVGEKFTVEASFKNPLNTAMTKCELRVEGPGLQRPKMIPQRNVEASSTFSASFDITPAKPGDREIVAVFNSAQIASVTGTHKVKVTQ